jgi:hypothetical protein
MKVSQGAVYEHNILGPEKIGAFCSFSRLKIDSLRIKKQPKGDFD